MPRRQLSRGEIDALLQKVPAGHLGLSKNGQPYVVPMYFVYDAGKIYLHSKGSGRKLDCIRANPKVCFEVSELLSLKEGPQPCKCGARYNSVIIQGRAGIVENEVEKVRALHALTVKFVAALAEAPMPDEEIARTTVIAISIDEATGKSLS